VTIDLGQAVSDTLAVRLNALYEHSYGFRNFFELQRYGINPAITWKPQQNTFVMLSYEHFRDWRTSDRGVPSIGMGSYFEGFPLRGAGRFRGRRGRDLQCEILSGDRQRRGRARLCAR
jgi:outer membrane receptor protein involved in Fe transport